MTRTTWVMENLKYLGKQVEITLDNNPESPVIVKGKLLSFCDDGEFEVQDEDGMVHYCWPMLTIREADMVTKVCPCCKGRWQNCDDCNGNCRSGCNNGTVER